jgi:hypothetical protein
MPRKADRQATKTQFLWKNVHSARYYVRAFRNGKEVWRTLKTSDYQVARQKSKEELADIHRSRDIEHSLTGKARFGDVAELWREKIKTDGSTKAGTKQYWQECLAALYRS